MALVDLALLEEKLAERGQPAYRAQQVWGWTARGVAGYETMTNVPAGLRAELAAGVPFSTVGREKQEAARAGTVKAFL